MRDRFPKCSRMTLQFKVIEEHNRLNVGRIALVRLVGAQINYSFQLTLSIKLPPIVFSCLKLWLRENFRSLKKQKVNGLKITRKVKTVKQKFCIKKTHTFTIIASLRQQLKMFKLILEKLLRYDWWAVGWTKKSQSKNTTKLTATNFQLCNMRFEKNISY